MDGTAGGQILTHTFRISFADPKSYKEAETGTRWHSLGQVRV